MVFQLFVGPWPLFQFLNHTESVGSTGQVIDPLQCSYLHRVDEQLSFTPARIVLQHLRWRLSIPPKRHSIWKELLGIIKEDKIIGTKLYKSYGVVMRNIPTGFEYWD
jgi:hypothetical protein